MVMAFFALSSAFYSQGADNSSIEALAEAKSTLRQKCSLTGCHSGKHPVANLNLETEKFPASVAGVPSREMPDFKVVDPGSPEKCYLIAKVKGESAILGKRMPIHRDPLTDENVRQIEEGIEGPSGAGVIFNSRLTGPSPAMGLSPRKGQDSAQALKPKRITRPAFWGTRLVNLPTTTTLGKEEFLFRVSHRFQPAVSSGWDSFFGFDGPAYILFSLGYGITDNITVTVGRSRLYQEWEFGADWAFLNQGEASSFPFSATLHAGGNVVTQDKPAGAQWSGRFRLTALLSLTYQLSDRLSFLVVPAFSSNTNFWEPGSEGTFALGIGGRFMVFDEISIIGEWVPPLAGYKDRYAGWGLGVEKKIGGHVFQFFATDSIGLTAAQYLPGGDLRLGDGNFRLGFNIFRTF